MARDHFEHRPAPACEANNYDPGQQVALVAIGAEIPRLMGTHEDYEWLIGAAAQGWLVTLAELRRGGDSTVNQLQRLRKELPLERAHLLVEQLELRWRAREKFSQADVLFFTKKGLEQATDEVLAAYKATRFGGQACIADVCCGIGGDLLALARCSPAVGIDQDAAVAILATANLAAVGLADRARVVAAPASREDLGACSAWHGDPDRRTTPKRTTSLEHFSPALAELELLLHESPNAAVKLAPATEVPPAWAAQIEREWLGSRRECRQQVAWWGQLAHHPGKRVATIVERQERRTVVERSDSTLPQAQECGAFVFEPHSAVLAAQLAASLAGEHGLTPLNASATYLTGDRRICDLALDAFAVDDVLPFDRKQLRSYCRERGLARLEIKKRNVDVDPERLRREIVGQGEEAATILVTPLGGKVRAIIARRLPSEAPLASE